MGVAQREAAHSFRGDCANCVHSYRRPARVGLEPLTVCLGKRFQPCSHDVDATLACVVERATAERREACTKDDARIEQIGICDNAICQAGDTASLTIDSTSRSSASSGIVDGSRGGLCALPSCHS